MSKQHVLQWFATFALAASLSAVAAPGPEDALNHLPPELQKTIRATIGAGKFRSIETNDQDGEITYDIEMLGSGGRPRSFTLATDGTLLDKEVFMNELSPAVRQAIRKKAGSAVVGDIDKSISNDEVTYDVEITSNGKTRSFTVDSAGKVTDEEVFLPELPDAFQAAIRKQTGGAAIDEITRSFDEETSYDVDIITNSRTLTLTFDSAGVFLSKQEDVTVAEVSEAVRKEIQSCAANGKIIAIQRATENGEISFDVDVRQDGKTKSYTIDASGKLVESGTD